MRKKKKINSRSLAVSAVALTALILVVGSADARNPADADDMLCLHFTGDSKDLLVELHRGVIMSGTLPLTVCGLRAGDSYLLALRGRGFETRRGILTIDESGKPSVRGNRLGTFARNIVPGWGSIREERSRDGWTDIISIAAAGMISLMEYNEYTHIENRLAILNEQLSAATTAGERQRIRIDANRASRDLNVQNDHRKRCLAYTAYLYGFQLIDPWFVGNPPKAKVITGGSVIEVSGSGESAFKAAFLSLVRPGRGQFYQGKIVRGTFYSLATALGVLVSLDHLNKYEEAVNAYELNLEYYYRSDTVDEKEYYSSRSDEYWADVEKTRRWRNISYGLLAGVWAAGVMDAFFPVSDAAPPMGLTYSLGPSHAYLVYRF
jgi:hypothetical protein